MKTMIAAVVGKIVRRILFRFHGYTAYAADMLSKDIAEDFCNGKASLSKKIWAYRRGFLGRRIRDYGLNEANYKDYQSDFHYYKLHPYNEFTRLIDDKLAFRYIFQPFGEYLPRYYFALTKGRLYKLADCPVDLEATIVSVLAFVKKEKNLAVKMVGGEGGEGFYKLSYDDSQYTLNDKLIGERELERFLAGRNNYIVTEYLFSHSAIRRIYDRAANTLRLLVVQNYGEEPVIIGAVFRIGTSASGNVDNIVAGAMLCGVDLTSGMMFDPRCKKEGEWVSTPEHVDSKVRIEGVLPHWELIISRVKEMSRFLPGYKYMGFDIVITEQGFKCIEINSLPCINVIQFYWPLLKNEHMLKLFSVVEKNRRAR